MTTSDRVTFLEIDESLYPLRIEFYRRSWPWRSLRVLTVAGPGAIRIPSNEELGGGKIDIKITYGNGEVHTARAS